MIKGKRGEYAETTLPYNIGEWVMVHTNGTEQKVAKIVRANRLGVGVRFFKTEVWTEIESGNEQYDITHIDHNVPVTSIACVIPEEVAKNLLLLQGVEL